MESLRKHVERLRKNANKKYRNYQEMANELEVEVHAFLEAFDEETDRRQAVVDKMETSPASTGCGESRLKAFVSDSTR